MGFNETFTAAIHFDSELKTFSTGFEETVTVVDISSDIEHSNLSLYIIICYYLKTLGLSLTICNNLSLSVTICHYL